MLIAKNPIAMKKLLSLLFCFTIVLASCKKDDAPAPELNIDNAEMHFDANRTPTSVNVFSVTSNREYTINVDVDWILFQTADTPPGIKNVHEVHVTKSNESFEPRTATITVSLKSGELNKTIKVTQAAKEHSLSLNANELAFKADGTPESSNTITVTATTGWEVIYQNENDKEWCKLDKVSANESATVVASITTKSTEKRTAKLTIKMGDKQAELAITQAGTGNVFDDIKDPVFKAYCAQFDLNSDGVLAIVEAQAVTSIDMYDLNSTSLKGIEYFTGLLNLSCYKNLLTELDVSKNIRLTHLECDMNQLTQLDISKNVELTYLSCGFNQLSTIDASMLTKLERLSCYRNQLTKLDISNNSKLKILNCHNNQLTSIDVSGNTLLMSIWCHQNQLTSITLGNNANFKDLLCSDNLLTSLDISQNTGLNLIRCKGNQNLNIIYVWGSFDLDVPTNSISGIDKDSHTVFQKK